MMLTLTFDGTASTCGINSCNSYVAFFEQSDIVSGDGVLHINIINGGINQDLVISQVYNTMLALIDALCLLLLSAGATAAPATRACSPDPAELCRVHDFDTCALQPAVR